MDVEAHGVLSAGGDVLLYDSLLVACGTRSEQALPGALSFGSPGDAGPVRTLLADIDSGSCRRVAFAVPAGVGWALSVYELALAWNRP